MGRYDHYYYYYYYYYYYHQVNLAEYDEWKRKGMAQGAPEPKRVLPQRPKLKGGAARRSMAKEFVDHLDELKPLNEAEVLSYVETVFRKDRIYTRTGQTLVAVNPFKWMLPAFTDAVVEKYHAAVSDDDAVRKEMSHQKCKYMHVIS